MRRAALLIVWGANAAVPKGEAPGDFVLTHRFQVVDWQGFSVKDPHVTLQPPDRVGLDFDAQTQIFEMRCHGGDCHDVIATISDPDHAALTLSYCDLLGAALQRLGPPGSVYIWVGGTWFPPYPDPQRVALVAGDKADEAAILNLEALGLIAVPNLSAPGLATLEHRDGSTFRAEDMRTLRQAPGIAATHRVYETVPKGTAIPVSAITVELAPGADQAQFRARAAELGLQPSLAYGFAAGLLTDALGTAWPDLAALQVLADRLWEDTEVLDAYPKRLETLTERSKGERGG